MIPTGDFPNLKNADNTVIVTGDGSVSSPAMPVKDALARIAAAGGFAYAAHPFDPISPVMRGGKWDIDADFLAPGGKQLQAGLAGLEPWNRATMATADDMRDPFCIRHHDDASACFQHDPALTSTRAWKMESRGDGNRCFSADWSRGAMERTPRSSSPFSPPGRMPTAT